MAGAAPGGVAANPMQQAAGAQQAALAGTATAGTVGGANLNQYMNPYTTQVINAQNADIMRGAQMGLNDLGTAASRAGAFGGSRHGVAMSELGRGAAQLMGQQSAALRQSAFQNAQTMAQQDIQNRMSQAAQLGNLGQQSFGYGQSIQGNLAQQGQQQQMLNQALIDAAKAQFGAYTQSPTAGLSIMTQALGASPHGQTQTSSSSPGLFGVLSAMAPMFASSDSRLKESIKKVGELANGVGVYTWKWTKEAIEAGKANAMLKGVIAQEVREKFPDAVKVDHDGYMMVNYNHPELKGAI
jgi:hypothetical protein